jgi:hypothetical protein
LNHCVAPPAGVIEDPDHADDRGRQNGPATGLIVEGNVTPDHGEVERPARGRDALDRFGELPENLGPFRRAEVQAVGDAARLATRAGHVAGRLAYGHRRALPGIEEHVAAVAVGGHRERVPRAFDAKDGGVGAGQHQGVDPDLLIVLAERPFLGRDRRRREQLGQGRAIVSRLRQGQRIEGAALGEPRRLGRGLAVFGCFGQQIDRHPRHDLALEPRGQLGALGHRADLDRVELPFREHPPHFLLAAARGDEQHALLRLGQ